MGYDRGRRRGRDKRDGFGEDGFDPFGGGNDGFSPPREFGGGDRFGGGGDRFGGGGDRYGGGGAPYGGGAYCGAPAHVISLVGLARAFRSIATGGAVAVLVWFLFGGVAAALGIGVLLTLVLAQQHPLRSPARLFWWLAALSFALVAAGAYPSVESGGKKVCPAGRGARVTGHTLPSDAGISIS